MAGQQLRTLTRRERAIVTRYRPQHGQVMAPAASVQDVDGAIGALVTRVVNFELETAFVSEPFTAPSLQARHVFEERLVLGGGWPTFTVSGW